MASLRIFHVSDLHFGQVGDQSAKARRLLEDVRGEFNHETDYLAVTGDFVESPIESQFAEAAAALQPFTGRLLLQGGNHDVTDHGNFDYQPDKARRFEDHLLTPLGIAKGFIDKTPMVDVLRSSDIEVLAVGLNSNRLTHGFEDWAQGEIGEQQLGQLATILDDPAHAGRWRFVYMHHRPEHTGLINPFMKLRDRDALMNVLRNRAHVLAFGHSGGSGKPHSHPLEKLGMKSPKDGAPWLLNANNSVDERQCFIVTLEGPPAPGVQANVIWRHFA